MNEDDKKYIAFLAGILQKVIYNEPLSDNEMHSLSNIVDELGFYKLDENEFRW